MTEKIQIGVVNGEIDDDRARRTRDPKAKKTRRTNEVSRRRGEKCLDELVFQFDDFVLKFFERRTEQFDETALIVNADLTGRAKSEQRVRRRVTKSKA